MAKVKETNETVEKEEVKVTPKNLFEKLSRVMEDCRYITRAGTNSFHKYNYVKASDIINKVNDSLTSYKLATTVDVDILEFKDYANAKGAIEKFATVKIKITIFDSESEKSVTISGLGSGQDAGDKAIMKAQTAAIKYAWMLSLNIATGDDPEADEKTDHNNNVQQPQNQNQNNATNANNNAVKCTCSECGKDVAEKVANFSKNKFGTVLCFEDQKKRG